MLLEQTHGVFAPAGSNTRNHRVAWKTQGLHWHCGEAPHNVAAVRTGCGGSEVPKLRCVLVKQRGVAKQNHPRVVRSSAKLGYRNCQGAHAAFTRKYQPGSEHTTALWLWEKGQVQDLRTRTKLPCVWSIYYSKNTPAINSSRTLQCSLRQQLMR